MPKVKRFGVDRLPRAVRAKFPEAKTVSDSTEPIWIRVTSRDKREATTSDPSACAMARACKRAQHADGAWIGISIAYVLNGTHLTRYLTPQSVAREIVTFDRHQDFASGDYHLASIPPSIAKSSKQMGAHAGRRGTGKGKPKPRGPHVVHHHKTAGIRKSSTAAA